MADDTPTTPAPGASASPLQVELHALIAHLSAEAQLALGRLLQVWVKEAKAEGAPGRGTS
jgi:hypothetical protein